MSREGEEIGGRNRRFWVDAGTLRMEEH